MTKTKKPDPKVLEAWEKPYPLWCDIEVGIRAGTVRAVDADKVNTERVNKGQPPIVLGHATRFG